MLDQETTGIDAGPAAEPADRRLADEFGHSLGCEPDVLALLVLGHVGVVDPAPAVTDHLVARLDEGARQLGVALQAARHAENADPDVEGIRKSLHEPTRGPYSNTDSTSRLRWASSDG